MGLGEAEMSEGASCMMKDGNWNFGGDHFAVYTNIKLKYCIPETYIMLHNNLIPVFKKNMY